MFKKTPLCKGLMLAFGGSVVLGMLPSVAKAQRVEITGSSIRQISSETALPVTVLKTDDLAKAGVTNAEQALAFITSNQSSINSCVLGRQPQRRRILCRPARLGRRTHAGAGQRQAHGQQPV